ncbi:MAG: hypothetical protein J0M08_06600 [Bacteroidetes bacterium]|nr:hypothetical protein [Bacteroidota bacterium]
MKKVFVASLTTLLGVVLTIASCKKPELDTETQSSVDNAICEAEFAKIVPSANDNAVKQPGAKKTETGGCATVTIGDTTLLAWPRVMTILYDTASGCVGNDQKVRKGRIVISLNRRWGVPHPTNPLATITLVDYYVNGIKFEGTMTVYKPALNKFRTVLQNGKCSNNSWNMSWNCDRTTTVNYAAGTDSVATIQIDGDADGVNRKGVAYTANIISSLIKPVDCKWFTSGVLDLKPDGKSTRTIDYSVGGGGCDSKASLTINGNSFEFDMD